MNRRHVTEALDRVPADTPVRVEFIDRYGMKCVCDNLCVQMTMDECGWNVSIMCKEPDYDK